MTICSLCDSCPSQRRQKNIAFERDFCSGKNHLYKNFYCRRNYFSDWFGSCGCVSEYIRVCSSDFPLLSVRVRELEYGVPERGERGGERSGIDGFGFIGVTGRRWKRRRRERKEEKGWVHKSCKGCAGWDGAEGSVPPLGPKDEIDSQHKQLLLLLLFSCERSSWLCVVSNSNCFIQ